MTKKILIPIFAIGFIGLIYLYISYGVANYNILLSIRLPRLLLAFLSGFILAGVGYAFQVMLDNPLAEPYILGISSGAAFGSILATVSGMFLLMPIFGFVGALLTMFLVWNLAHIGGIFDKTKLLLSGIIVGMFFSALISLIIFFNQQDISNILSILMGNLGHIFSILEWKIFTAVFAISIGLMIYLFSLAKQLQIISTGDLVAVSLGIDIKKLRRRIFIVSSLLTGVTVAYAGIIGFIGLVVPHLIRMLFSSRQDIIYSALGGAFLLILCDFIAMHIAVVELPVGIITSFIGCPFFIYVMSKRK
jgi:iron complex transport system permease protein